MLSREENSVIFYSFESPFTNIDNCPCSMIYNIEQTETQVNVFIMYVATKYKYRSFGYASVFINEFIQFIKDKYKELNVTIILNSVKRSVSFYERIGFQLVTTDEYNSQLKINDDKIENNVMKYIL